MLRHLLITAVLFGLTLAGPSVAAGDDKESVFWQSIQGSKDASDYQDYLSLFPNGTFAALAKNRIGELQGKAAAAPEPPRPNIAVDATDREMVAGRKVAVRGAPDAKSKAVATLDEGQSIQVIGKVRGENWLVVTRKGLASGYVVADAMEDPAAYGSRIAKAEAERQRAEAEAAAAETARAQATEAARQAQVAREQEAARQAAGISAAQPQAMIGIMAAPGRGTAPAATEQMKALEAYINSRRR